MFDALSMVFDYFVLAIVIFKWRNQQWRNNDEKRKKGREELGFASQRTYDTVESDSTSYTVSSGVVVYWRCDRRFSNLKMCPISNNRRNESIAGVRTLLL